MTVTDIVKRGRTASGLADELRELGTLTLEARSAGRLHAAMRSGCWIYGAGSYGQLIARLLADRGITVRGFIDRRAGDPALAALGLPVLAPDSIDDHLLGSSALVIAIHNFAADQLPVVRWARSIGAGEVIIPAELPDLLGPEAGSYWLVGRDHTLRHLDALIESIALFDDPMSIATIAQIARFRISGEIEEHPASTLADQYFPVDLPLGPEPLRLVDGGAYVGDALDAVKRAGGAIAEWFAFEPDPANFSQLAAVIGKAGIQKAALFPCGLGDGLKQLRFATGGRDGSRASETGDAMIQVVALDDVLLGASPNFIKLDIEGAEAEALDGMAKTLRLNQPRLAISIYHKPADLWELPLKVARMLPRARLHVRQHGYNGFDTVLYAIP